MEVEERSGPHSFRRRSYYLGSIPPRSLKRRSRVALSRLCVGSQPFCGPAAARRGGCEQWDRSGFIPACSRCRFFSEILLILFVDKVVPELLLLDCAAEPVNRPLEAEM